jgi:hypothetical protein
MKLRFSVQEVLLCATKVDVPLRIIEQLCASMRPLFDVESPQARIAASCPAGEVRVGSSVDYELTTNESGLERLLQPARLRIEDAQRSPFAASVSWSTHHSRDLFEPFVG